ncbi:phosphoribosylaminoimidazole synthetase [Clostridium botulinum CFSAN002369]|nr:phosphoribosylaminoimidazole synthetase [Clostridium botulinum CFSAN002369]
MRITNNVKKGMLFMVSYKEAGVNIEEGYKSVDLIKNMLQRHLQREY